MMWNGIFETFNLKGRRGSRERKESAAIRRECWRVLDHRSVFARAFLSGILDSSGCAMAAALRRECWRVLDLFSGLGKSLPERNRWIPWAARLPSTLTPNVVIAFFFASLFSIDFWKAFFRFLVIFGSPWGPQKTSKIAKSRSWRPSFF